MGTAELIAAAHSFKKISVIAGVGPGSYLEMFGGCNRLILKMKIDESGCCGCSNGWEQMVICKVD